MPIALGPQKLNVVVGVFPAKRKRHDVVELVVVTQRFATARAFAALEFK